MVDKNLIVDTLDLINARPVSTFASWVLGLKTYRTILSMGLIMVILVNGCRVICWNRESLPVAPFLKRKEPPSTPPAVIYRQLLAPSKHFPLHSDQRTSFLCGILKYGKGPYLTGYFIILDLEESDPFLPALPLSPLLSGVLLLWGDLFYLKFSFKTSFLGFGILT